MDLEAIYNKLENDIFCQPHHHQIGAKTYLNIDCIWESFWYIRESMMNEIERACIIDYRLQVLLIETFQIKINYSSLDSFLYSILDIIRRDSSYWMEDSEVYNEINEKMNPKIIEENEIDLISEKSETMEHENDLIANINQITQSKAIENFLDYHNEAEKILKKESSFSQSTTFDLNMIELQKIITRTNSTIIEYVLEALSKFKQKRKNYISGEPRVTRNVLKQGITANTLKLSERLADDQSFVESQLYLDLSASKPLDYANRPFFSAKYSCFTKVPLMVMPILFRYCIRVSAPKIYKAVFKNKRGVLASPSGLHFRLLHLLQNFMLSLMHKPRPTIVPAGKNRTIKQASMLSIEQWIEEFCSFTPSKLLIGLLKFDQIHSLELGGILSRVEKVREQQLRFINGSLYAFVNYIQIKTGKERNNPMLRRTGDNRAVDCRTCSDSRKVLANIENLDLNSSLNRYLIRRAVKSFIIRTEGEMSSSSKETLHGYSSILSKKENAINLGVNVYSYEIDHDNQYNIKEPECVLSRYSLYLNDPSISQKRWYKFHSDSGFRWTSRYYKRLIEGYLIHKNSTVNNSKIAEFIGDDVSVNHVKYLKYRFLRLAKLRARKARISLNEQLKIDIKQFDFAVLFPWLSDENLIEEDNLEH